MQRNIIRATACALLMLCGTASAKDYGDALRQCGNIDDDKKRLDCYDDVLFAMNAEARKLMYKQTEQSQLRQQYLEMSLTDLKVDARSLYGKKVQVTAGLQVLGSSALLKDDPHDRTPIWAMTDRLSREDRVYITTTCQKKLCKGNFYGSVVMGVPGPTLLLEAVEWQ